MARQFWAGILPGILMGGFLALAAVLVVRARGWGQKEVVLLPLGRVFAEAFPGLLTPIIILGGIYGGVFTPTEAAAVGVFWGVFVGMVFYRSLRLKDLPGVLVDAGVSSAVVMAIVAWAGLFAWAADTVGLVGQATRLLLGLEGNPLLLLALLNLLWLLLGMLLDAVSIYYLTLPILLPVMAHLGGTLSGWASS